ncbi:MAG: hypothetical protein U9N59_06845 [Campylobacterota bacterium]|nr:hypothetical protein [Campylobacterota bacterium]
MEAKELIKKMMEYYNIHTISELSDHIGIGQPAISKWKSNNSINMIKKKCRELGIYNDIFEGEINNFQHSRNDIAQNFGDNNQSSHSNSESNIDVVSLKLFDTLYSFAKQNGKLNELTKELSSLLPKYMS